MTGVKVDGLTVGCAAVSLDGSHTHFTAEVSCSRIELTNTRPGMVASGAGSFSS